MKISPKLDFGSLVAFEEILGGGAVAAWLVAAVIDDVFDGAGVPDADSDAPDDALAALPVVEDVEDDEDDVEVLEELEVEVTVEVIVN
jgi:hypothetical protein